MADQKRDSYEVLGVDKGADDATLKKAYREMAKKYHPDMHPGDKDAEAKFKEASEAYAVLSDPDKRRQYDQFGHSAFDGGMGGGAGGFDFSGMDFSDIFGDIFGDFFGGGRSSRSSNGPMKGSNIRTSIRIKFEEAAFGCEKEIELPLKDQRDRYAQSDRPQEEGYLQDVYRRDPRDDIHHGDTGHSDHVLRARAADKDNVLSRRHVYGKA